MVARLYSLRLLTKGYSLVLIGCLGFAGLSGCGEPSVECQQRIAKLQGAAEAGRADAQYELGQIYEHGECVSRNFEEAARWYHLAAEQGHATAQKALGFMYAGGIGVARDPQEALYWFQKAAAQGDPEAQVGLGIAYYRGIGVARDLEKAAEWLRRSAEQGFARGQYNLGHLYESGQGMPLDYVQAYRWYKLAARDYPKAKEALERLAKQMTPLQLEEANRLVEEPRLQLE